MRLGAKQEKFIEMLGLLIRFAYAKGYRLRGGDLWAREKEGAHCKGSFHYKKLAIDLNLFKDGKYLTRTKDHQPLGEFWESIGGSWGGRWNDGNHYSLGEKK